MGKPFAFVSISGLWIFSRSPTRDEVLIEKVRSIAQDAGFDLSVLNDVDQQNCEDGATCLDDEGEFNVGFGLKKTCGWVGERSWHRCFFFEGYCPKTCGACN